MYSESKHAYTNLLFAHAKLHFSHLSSLCGCSKAWVDSIKFPYSHHARVYLVVQLQSEYGDQHRAYIPNQIRAKKTGADRQQELFLAL